MNVWLKKNRSLMPIKDIWQKLRSKLTGHYNYYGISGNFDGINKYYHKTLGLTFKWMNRKSQKKMFNWDRFWQYLKTYPLPEPKLTYAIQHLVNIVYRRAGCGKSAYPVQSGVSITF